MDTFYEQDAAGLQLQGLSVVFPHTGDEVVLRYGDFLSGDEFHDVALHQSVVYGFEVVEVVRAVGEFGRVQAVDEIIVRRHGHGLDAAGLQLQGKTLAEGGLA